MLITRRRTFALLSASALAACASEVDPEHAVAGAPLGTTPSETEGPFFPENTNLEHDADLTRLAGRSDRAAGQVILMRGRVLNHAGLPVTGARVQLWQANAAGRYAHTRDAANPAPIDPNFQGYGVVQTGADGAFSFTTIKPGGYVVDQAGPRTPHMHWKIAGAGRELTTQSYFPGEPANETDFLIRAMGDRANYLIATAGEGADGALGFDWNVVLRE